ncbi:hypothetical protein [Mesorhizobium kowhaii]|uniref:DUF3592 domain-containing protein n=1 Tax=Mesorhizobium kowhaii TaxID=1300272 RepID=A0A2W7BSA6_9HYPH|nr:hypothetical protein [Mesorhizobium kowhaii]PZV33720.1 hypothetical protein B5V02_36085 [Mesorhizobium kowhaii]
MIGVALFCAIALVKSLPILTRQYSPIVDTQRVSGIVEYVTMPQNPKVSIGRGFYFTYEVRLQDINAVVFVDGEVDTPHRIGSEVSLERQHHQNGTDTYRLLNG